ncbi:MAG: heparinase II/III family protein, partial [Pedobacter sp.]
GKFYESALDERGQFDVSKGDKSLLFNTEHPDPSDPLHKYGVDDGFGFIDQNGRAHRFIGYYVWKKWDYISDGLAALAEAYLYTGDKMYARKAAIILDRIADVYPEMDWKPYADKGWYHSDGGRNMGKIHGRIWETGLITSFADSYDKILNGTTDNPELYSFLKNQSAKYKIGTKGNRMLFVQNVDNGLLRTAFKSILSGQVTGNQGMHQLTAIVCAMALDSQPESNEWIDWIFASDGGNIPSLMISTFDRDGTSNEGAPGYALMWGRLISQVAERLQEYPAYTKHNIIKEFPQFNTTFLAAYRMAALGIAIPNMGDSGSTGMVSNGYADPNFITKGYIFTRDPEFAKAAYIANKNSADKLGRNIFSVDPDATSKEIKRIGENAGQRAEGGYLMSGFGLALLENGRGNSGVAIASNYGRTIMHAHPDLMNFDLLAFGKWLAPDHGYPEFATNIPSNREWTGSTASHNLVFVNEKPQQEIWGGHTKLFKQIKGFGVFEIDGKKAYPETKTYQRTMLLIDAGADSNAYVIDLFKVEGGYDHLYSFHGPPGEITNTGLKLSAQNKGTYAGEDIEKGSAASGTPYGYSFFYNVQRDMNPPSQFMLDWKTETGYRGLKEDENVHLRMYALSPSGDVAIADGDPPQNKPGNPKKLGYVLMHRKGEDLNSTFVSVFEPYRQNPFIKSVKRIDNGDESQIALQIEHTNGAIDYVLYNPESDKLMKLPDNTSMSGNIGFIRKQNNQVNKAILVNGTTLNHGSFNLKSGGQIKGKIVKMNKNPSGSGWVLVDQILPGNGSLNGEQLIISTSGERDATYTIKSIKREGKYSRIECGPITFAKGFKNPAVNDSKDPYANYTYEFEEGAAFSITSHTEWLSK